MQLVNDTDEPITLAPGEALTFDSTIRRFNDVPYRVTIDGRPTRLPADELQGPFTEMLNDEGGDA